MPQTNLLDVDKPPKVKGHGPMTAAQWQGFADWMAELESLIGTDRVLRCTIWGCPYYLSGWSPQQFVRHRIEPYEAARQ